MSVLPVLASVIDWGWLRIGPPYISININPVLAQFGPLQLHWYGLMGCVAKTLRGTPWAEAPRSCSA
jgi:hypothetical protein